LLEFECLIVINAISISVMNKDVYIAITVLSF